METKEKTPDLGKKCFCARCFLPIVADADDKIDIEGQSFHRICSKCCVCRNVPKSLKTFYGHVFCTDCFKTHVLSRFRGEQRLQSNSWWTPVAGEKRGRASEKEDARTVPEEPKDLREDSSKKPICARCLQTIPQDKPLTIGGQVFHQPCAICCCCHAVPTDSVKIYYGQVFCEQCFDRNVINRDKDDPTEFFKSCFDCWNNSPQFADQMRDFMSSGKSPTSPVVFMMQGQQPFCRCSGPETQPPPEAKQCKMAVGEPPRRAARAARSLAKGDAHSPPPRALGPLQRHWCDATLHHDTGLPQNAIQSRQSLLWNQAPNRLDGDSPPRQKRFQRHYKPSRVNDNLRIDVGLDDIAQRFSAAVRHHGNISLLDDTESRDGGRDFEPLAQDDGSLRSRESQSPVRHDDSLYFYNESVQRGDGSPTRGDRSPRHGTETPTRGDISPRHGHGSPKRGDRSPRHDTGSPKRANRSPRYDTGLPKRANRSPRHGNGSPGHESSALLSESGWLRNDTTSLTSGYGCVLNESGSLGQDYESVQPLSAGSSLIPLFQSSLEHSRNASPRRFLRNHEKPKLAAATVHAGEDLDNWDLLSTRTGATDPNEDLGWAGNASANLDEIADAAEREKIEKLTQYLHRQKNPNKNWKTFYDTAVSERKSQKAVLDCGDEWKEDLSGWVDIQLCEKKSEKCPKCLWQSGIFTVDSGLVSTLLMSGGSSFFE